MAEILIKNNISNKVTAASNVFLKRDPGKSSATKDISLGKDFGTEPDDNIRLIIIEDLGFLVHKVS